MKRRKAAAILLCTLMSLSLAACGSRDTTGQTETGTENTDAAEEADTGADTAEAGSAGGQDAGAETDTAQTAENGGTHDELLEFAYNEMTENARPELASRIENLDSYDTVFLGYPNWNADLPMPLYTFLEEYNFSGKTIIPFTTHGGSGFSNTIRTIEELQPDASVVEDGLSIPRGNVPDAGSDVTDWLAGLGFSE